MGRRDSSGGWRLPGYEHFRVLGSGAGGQVWLAVHGGSGTPVAVKYLAPGLRAGRDFREAYRAEAVLLAALDSPHVARLYEYVEGPAGAAIVMEAVEGASLRELIKREGPAASPEAALSILKGSLLGLAAAHTVGVVHRDYKPANVLVTPEGASKLVDFGIAARGGEAAAAAGTPLYMAPEQFHGVPASPAGDVYAATVTFFECVTGERPFPGANAVELMAQHALGRIPDELAPEAVRGLIRWGMAKSPQDRPGDASLLLHELEAAASSAFGADWEARGRRELAAALALLPMLLAAEAVGSVPAGTTSFATTALASDRRPDGRRGPDRRRRDARRRRLRASIGAGAGALILVAAAVAAAYASDPHPDSGSGTAGGAHADEAALTSATTLVSPAARVDPPPVAKVTPSTKPSASSSPSPTTASQQSSTPAKAASSAAPTGTPSRTASAAAPSISGVAITSVYCVGDGPVVDAKATVTSNGAGGSVTFSWFYETAAGTAQAVGSPVTVSLKAGQTSQVVNPAQGVDFSDYEDFYPRWGVQVSSTPTASTDNSPQLVQGSAADCGMN